MPQVAYPAVAEGPLEVSSGLSVHQGVQSASCMRVTGSRNGVSVIWPRDGAGGRSGLELTHTPYSTSAIQSYDREHSLWLDLAINAKIITLAPQGGGKVSLPAGTAQALLGSYINPPTWSTPATGTYYETPIQVNAISTGVLTRLECGVSFVAGAAGQGVFLSFGVDGALQAGTPLGVINAQTNGYVYVMSAVAYVTPTAGARRFSVMMMSSPGTISMYTGAYQWLHVTEQRA